jgi:ribonuclease P protein component
MVVSRRVSLRAVDRNRIRRVIRETFRQNQDRLDAIDIVVVAKTPAAAAAGQDLNNALIGLWMQLLEKCRKP